MFARQVPGMRFPTFFFAGASDVSLSRFYLIDGVSAIITVSVYFGLGYAFADDISEVKKQVVYFVDYAGVIAGFILLSLIVFIGYRRFNSKEKLK